MSTFRRRPPREDLFHLAVSGRFLTTGEGGRKGPIASDYRPNCWFGDEIGGTRLYNDVALYFRPGADAREDQGTLWVPPGGSFRADAFPLYASFVRSRVKRGTSFEICEGARVVGTATIEEVVDPRPEEPVLLYDSRRRFQLWQAGVGHHHLLLRSTKDADDSQTKVRVDVLFKPVRAMKLPSVLDGLRITELADADAAAIHAELGDADTDAASRVYQVESKGFRGWVVAGVMAAHWDDLDYSEPSWFFRAPDEPLSL